MEEIKLEVYIHVWMADFLGWDRFSIMADNVATLFSHFIIIISSTERVTLAFNSEVFVKTVNTSSSTWAQGTMKICQAFSLMSFLCPFKSQHVTNDDNDIIRIAAVTIPHSGPFPSTPYSYETVQRLCHLVLIVASETLFHFTVGELEIWRDLVPGIGAHNNARAPGLPEDTVLPSIWTACSARSILPAMY